MNKETQMIRDDLNRLAKDAHAFMTATADVAGDKVAEARKSLGAALERSKEICGTMREKTVEGAKLADKALHEHPYQAIAMGFGVGAVLGLFVANRCSRKGG